VYEIRLNDVVNPDVSVVAPGGEMGDHCSTYDLDRVSDDAINRGVDDNDDPRLNGREGDVETLAIRGTWGFNMIFK
jgi:hypothetical protein